jgi:dTDP-4-amino-4,6-dideoxygalactose transaminase
MHTSIPYTNLDQQWSEIRDEAIPLIDKVLSSGKYLAHELVEELECELANYVNAEEVILVNSGTDALMLALMSLNIGKGDEVLTVPNSFIASVAAIAHVGATPVIVDVGLDHLIDPEQIEASITSRTKAIMPVHLEGKVCDMEKINQIANKYNLAVIEDAAQAFGSKLNGRPVGSLSDITCFSLHPLKNLNACGDGGFIATNNSKTSLKIRRFRNHGQQERNLSNEFGVVSRFDSIQAAIVKIRLRGIENIITRRRANAQIYDNIFGTSVTYPVIQNNVFHSYHSYCIEVNNRDKIAKNLLRCGIETKVHYPKLITDQAAFTSRFKASNTPVATKQKDLILSLPIHTSLSVDDLNLVAIKIVELNDRYN